MESDYYTVEVKKNNIFDSTIDDILKIYYNNDLGRWTTSETSNDYLQYLNYKILERNIDNKRDVLLNELVGEKHFIKTRLDEYLEFDSSLLFVDELVRVFGGAIRDSIANQKINDVDILCGPKSCKILRQVLEYRGYKLMDKLSSVEFNKLYNGFHIINEPHTYIKGHKVVQLIRPSGSFKTGIRESFKELLQNVDISCCGVSWDGGKLYENYPDAVSHCRNKYYIVNTNAKMFIPERCSHRTFKLQDRGWLEINDISMIRDSKIDSILGKSIDYVSEINTKQFIVPGLKEELW